MNIDKLKEEGYTFADIAEQFAGQCSPSTDRIVDAIFISIREAIEDADVPEEYEDKVFDILNNEFNDWF